MVYLDKSLGRVLHFALSKLSHFVTSDTLCDKFYVTL